MLAQRSLFGYKSAVIRLARYMLIAALMLSIGAQWAVLQSAAWVSMAVTYSMKAGSVSEGLSKTFDGVHPCLLCCMVKKGAGSEKKDSKEESAKKMELFATVRATIVIATPAAVILPRAENQSATARATAPPHQPPRCA